MIVSILRAGNGILDGILDIIPSARVGYIGLYRDPKTLVATTSAANMAASRGRRVMRRCSA